MEKMYTEYIQEHNRYRTGGRELAPDVRLPQTTSSQAQWLGANESRIADRRLVKMEWASKSYSPLQVMGGRATGNSAMPTTLRAFRAIKRHDVQTYQLLVRGGMRARSWLTVEMKSEERGSSAESF